MGSVPSGFGVSTTQTPLLVQDFIVKLSNPLGDWLMRDRQDLASKTPARCMGGLSAQPISITEQKMAMFAADKWPYDALRLSRL